MPRVAKTKASAATAKKAAVPTKKKKIYTMPEKISKGTILTDLTKNQWKVGDSIGVGGFGEIYSACRANEKNYNYVVKCEPHENGPLFVEMHFYMRNAKLEDITKFKRERGLKSLGMPYMLGHGSADINEKKHRFIVIPRYGGDIAEHFNKNNDQLPEGTIYRLAIQMLDVYEFIHSRGSIHGDLKAENILLDLGKNGGSQTYLVDYGLAAHYTTKEFKPDVRKMHNGTIEYTSRDSHQGVSTMRSDFEILGYNLIEWMGVELPWVKGKLLTAPDKVQKSKEEFMSNIGINLKKLFIKAVPLALAEFMKYVANMKFDQTPEYNNCRKIFSNALKTLNFPDKGELLFKISKQNAATPKNKTPKSKAKVELTLRNNIAVDSSIEEINASSGEDNDAVFEKKKPVKVAPSKPKSPYTKSTPKKSPGKVVKNTTPKKNKLNKEAVAPAAKDINSNSPKELPNSKQNGTQYSTKANIKINPAISLSQTSNRIGKTIINDSTTPNPRSGKTYEFNFELDVSMDANVVVNVKRKKKPEITGSSLSSLGNRKSPRIRDTDEIDTSPVTKVKVRKLQSDDNASSPRTPAVTVKKSKRFNTPH